MTYLAFTILVSPSGNGAVPALREAELSCIDADLLVRRIFRFPEKT